MKLTRRKFFAGLAVAPLVAVAVAKAVPVLADNMSLALARWTKTEPLTTIYSPWPAATWRALYAGVQPQYQQLTQEDLDLGDLIERYTT